MTLFQIAIGVVESVNAAAIVGLNLVAVGFLSLVGLYLAQRRRPDPAGIVPSGVDRDQLPAVVVQLPVFNEPHVIDGLLESVAALDWPADRLHIQLLDDSSDETTRTAQAKIAQLGYRGLRIEHVRREHRDGFKAGALAAGLVLSDAPFVAILDADFRPPANWLMTVVPRLAADPVAGFIQSRCEFDNAGDNWLTRAQGLLFDAHFVMEQGVRARAGLLFQFNGTGAVWRRSTIEAIGGWSSDSLSEDLNLVIRAALAGWRGLYAAEPPVPGLVPHQVGHWRVQQQRWSMGFAQNARTLFTSLWRADWSLARRLSALFLLLYQAAFPMIVVAVVASAIDLAFRVPDLWLAGPLWALTAVMALALAIGMTLPPYLELRRGPLLRYAVSLVMVPLLVVFLAFSNARTIVAGVSGGGDIFRRTPKDGSGRLKTVEPVLGDGL
jgi:cellulose synthase/poly-beta-1,6-N-acetylglucosamine synthase-like glycosyltransferase